MTILNPCEWWESFTTVSGCTTYVFHSFDNDSLILGSPFTGNLKVILAGSTTTGIHPDVLAGLQGTFIPSTNLTESPEWNQFEIDTVALTYIVDTTFNGVVSYAKDDIWFKLDMGEV